MSDNGETMSRDNYLKLPLSRRLAALVVLGSDVSSQRSPKLMTTKQGPHKLLKKRNLGITKQGPHELMGPTNVPGTIQQGTAQRRQRGRKLGRWLVHTQHGRQQEHQTFCQGTCRRIRLLY